MTKHKQIKYHLKDYLYSQLQDPIFDWYNLHISHYRFHRDVTLVFNLFCKICDQLECQEYDQA